MGGRRGLFIKSSSWLPGEVSGGDVAEVMGGDAGGGFMYGEESEEKCEGGGGDWLITDREGEGEKKDEEGKDV